MARILTVIQPRAFERIRDRIGEILADELPVQAAIEYADELDAEVFVERFIPFDKTEMPAVNVLVARGLYDNKAALKSDGTYTFNIDCYMTAKTQAGKNGDSESAIKLQKLMGVCTAILENRQYNTLGFAKPFISHTEVREINIANPVNNQDASSVIMGRITFIVRVPETVDAILPQLLAGYDTVMKLYLTDKGYTFSVSPSLRPFATFTTSPSPASGDAPLDVAFTDASTNSPTSWLWNVSGGLLDIDYEFTVGSATSQNPTIRFITVADYQVSLTATNAYGSHTSSPATISAETSSAPGIVRNTSDTYHEEVPAGDTLILADTLYQVYVNGILKGSGSLPAMEDNIINVT